MRAMGVRCGLLAAMLVAIAIVAAPVSAQEPGTIVGETLFANGPTCGGAPCLRTEATCNADGTSTIRFTVTGTAVGPYPGTFSASGTVTVGPQTLRPPLGNYLYPVAGPVVGFSETFRIESGDTVITGTKDHKPSGLPGFEDIGAGVAACDPTHAGSEPGHNYRAVLPATYEATIQDSEGTVRQRGDTYMNFADTKFCELPICHYTDFAEAFYTAEPNRSTTLSLTPKAATNEVGTSHCVTATVTDTGGDPAAGTTVRFSVAGASNTEGQDVTGNDGEAEFCYEGPSFPGTDAITAFADEDGDGNQDPDESFDVASKVWVLPDSTPPCRVTNGGWITSIAGDHATFGGVARAVAGRATLGQEEYTDHGPVQPLKMKSTTVLAVVCNAARTQATIYGRATVEGEGEHYFRIRVSDGGSQGDTYGLLLSSGYYSGEQPLLGGDVQIR